jgi:hypothetical protein
MQNGRSDWLMLIMGGYRSQGFNVSSKWGISLAPVIIGNLIIQLKKLKNYSSDEIKVIKQYIEITNRDILDYKPPDLHASN